MSFFILCNPGLQTQRFRPSIQLLDKNDEILLRSLMFFTSNVVLYPKEIHNFI
jgi:hypothetical protein